MKRSTQATRRARSEGHARLLATGLGPSAIARRLSEAGHATSKQLVSGWLHGRSRPSYEARAVLATALGIESSAWDHEPPAVLKTDAPEPVAAESTPATPDAGELEGVIAQLRGARSAPGLSPSVIAKLVDSELRARALREKMISDLERACASDEFRALLKFVGRLLQNALAKRVPTMTDADRAEALRELIAEIEAELPAGAR